ncbi:PREDICTED: lipid transfer-like protein VAS [Nelumbo nucifera]|uniref:Bifunctional inhibitor/plant lipid transfer protein/seed storage helical domain-containing protein n=2 Tax=Nelumbo nucifera TaxID=4432 RepID=A0A822YXS2_NELNU|nr:PREDICTED: lipid transfer-like protein VAS [Nelumbo nucifera]DAD34048.1 TPA_asm: hypothetical protein HUJ06_004688 [Nelumbo nucifera]
MEKVWGGCRYVVVVVLGLAILAWKHCEAQDETSSCLNQLVPCLTYLNGTNIDPPSSCCDPLKSVIESNPECLCGLASAKGSTMAQQAGINITEAQQLPAKCGQSVNPISCLTDANKNTVPSSASGSGFSFVSIILAATLGMTVQCATYIFV